MKEGIKQSCRMEILVLDVRPRSVKARAMLKILKSQEFHPLFEDPHPGFPRG